MRFHFWFILLAAAVWPCLAQTSASTQPSELPKDPRALLDLALPSYDFSDPALKPWHLKASYQIYDEAGAPTMQGVFEYWWASPKVWSLRWSRPDATRSEWHTADGHSFYAETGGKLNYYEDRLRSALLEPLPKPGDLAPDKFQLKREEVKSTTNASVVFPCVEVIPRIVMPRMNWKTADVPLGLFPTYCFDSTRPFLRFQSSFGNLTVRYDSLAKTQNRVLAQDIVFQERTSKILTAHVDQTNGITATDAALTPPADAKLRPLKGTPSDKGKRVVVPNEKLGKLVRKVQPVYPVEAKDAHITGTVDLGAIIGRDGQVHELKVISAPWPSLAASALQAVSQWRYEPYSVNGEPVDVETTIHVIFMMSR